MEDKSKRNRTEDRRRKEQAVQPKNLEPQAKQKGPQQIPTSERGDDNMRR